MWLGLWMMACGPKDAVLEPDKLTLDFIVIDDTNNQLRRVDQLRGNNWTRDIPRGAIDIQHWDDDEVLVAHSAGAMRINIETGDTTWEVGGFIGVTSATPQPEDGVLLGVPGPNYITTFAVDRTGQDNGGGMTIPGIRLANIIRELPDNHILVTGGDPWYFSEMGGFNGTIWSASIPGRGWGAARMPNGTYLISTTDAVQVIELARTGETLATFSGAGQDEELGLRYFAGFDRLDGMTVIANWMATSDGPGAHVVGFQGANDLAWSWDDTTVGSVPGVAVLEVHYPE